MPIERGRYGKAGTSPLSNEKAVSYNALPILAAFQKNPRNLSKKLITVNSPIITSPIDKPQCQKKKSL